MDRLMLEILVYYLWYQIKIITKIYFVFVNYHKWNKIKLQDQHFIFLYIHNSMIWLNKIGKCFSSFALQLRIAQDLSLKSPSPELNGSTYVPALPAPRALLWNKRKHISRRGERYPDTLYIYIFEILSSRWNRKYENVFIQQTNDTLGLKCTLG